LREEEVFELYKKEREYEKKIFGLYKDNPIITPALISILIGNYCQKLMSGFSEPWSEELPEWMNNCYEMEKQGSVPLNVYEVLIKIFALSGAILEEFTEIDYEKWRNGTIKNKWKKNEEDGDNGRE